MIAINQLNFNFDKKAIFSKLNFVVDKGEIHALIGKTGAGKTVLLKLIANLIPNHFLPIDVDGKKISFVFQQSSFFPWLSMRENFNFNSQFTFEEIKEHFRTFGLDEYLNHYPKELSGGTLQKFNILRAFLATPDIILLDEPFSHLDIVQKEMLYDFLISMWKISAPSMVLVTHDIEEALRLSHSISFLSSKSKNITKAFKLRTTNEIPSLSIKALRLNDEMNNVFNIIYELLKDDLK